MAKSIRLAGIAATLFVWSSVLEGGGEVRVHFHELPNVPMASAPRDSEGEAAHVNRLGARESSLKQVWP